jgi:DNA-binding NarL/FixJ family response regulator
MECTTVIGVFLAEDHETVREGLRLLVNAQDDMRVIGEAGDG